MKQPKFINNTERNHKRHVPLFIKLSMTIPILLTGCASMYQKEESIDAILAKENAVIEKLKAERAQTEVSQAVQQSASLMKAEAHLALALDEIVKANEVVTTKLLKQDEKEVEIERLERSSR